MSDDAKPSGEDECSTCEQPECDNPSCENPPDYKVTVHYPQGDVKEKLCAKHSEGDVVTREETFKNA